MIAARKLFAVAFTLYLAIFVLVSAFLGHHPLDAAMMLVGHNV